MEQAGPGKSFPIPDCKHVIAARRLIGRFKGSESTKAKILACVSRKSKQLGCGGGGKDQAGDEVEKLIESSEFDDTRELIAFLEYAESGKTVEEKAGDMMKSSAAKLLDSLRSRRLGVEPDEDRAGSYMVRSLQSLFDSLVDEVNHETEE